MPEKTSIKDFIKRWDPSGGAELANYQMFLSELCDLLEVPRPDPTVPEDEKNHYVFEKSVPKYDAQGRVQSSGRIDLYKQGCFVLETKQGVEKEMGDTFLKLSTKRKTGHGVRGSGLWSTSMIAAKAQAENYTRGLPASQGRPPFVIVVDVGHCIELYSEFSCTGGAYVPFPDSQTYRIKLADLYLEEVRQRLKLVWTDPLSLDPSKRSAKVTRDIAENLGKLAKSFEKEGYSPLEVSNFLMRCLFTMFAEDVQLLPKDSFKNLLETRRDKLKTFVPMVEALWKDMDSGNFSTILEEKLLQFNGGLFEEPKALPVNQEQLELLIEAAKSDWREVEPAIFGTLLERALDPVERHKLGAHYTPRSYVERLVQPTIMKPLRKEWESVKAAVVSIVNKIHDLELEEEKKPQSPNGLVNENGIKRKALKKEAIEQILEYHRKLCKTKVLDPACGSGNFLYVSMELMKRLEGEVLSMLGDLGDHQEKLHLIGSGLTVDPHNFLGIEVNPRASAIAEMVLWIGYIQWHLRTKGKSLLEEPVLRNFKNIECRDALLVWDDVEPMLTKKGRSQTRWDGRTFTEDLETKQMIPDKTARVPILKYINPRKAQWPEADFVVSNPPFIGDKVMQQTLGAGYVEAVRSTYDELGASTDFVFYWWNKAALLARNQEIKRFGLITTNSIVHKFNRRVVEKHLTAEPPLSLLFAIADHPWVDTPDGAGVRIAMTVGTQGEKNGERLEVISERGKGPEGKEVVFKSFQGKIHADLKVGVDVASTQPLMSNSGLCYFGVMRNGSAFLVTNEQAKKLGLGTIDGLEKHIRPYRNGRDISAHSRDLLLIDLFGLDIQEAKKAFSEVYQWLFIRIKPKRDTMAEGGTKDSMAFARKWWLPGRPRPAMRKALAKLPRYIATPETSKHRVFQFLDSIILPDHMIVSIASDDSYLLGILSSKIHITWANHSGGTLVFAPRYNNTRTFAPFPFPDPPDDPHNLLHHNGSKTQGGFIQ